MNERNDAARNAADGMPKESNGTTTARGPSRLAPRIAQDETRRPRGAYGRKRRRETTGSPARDAREERARRAGAAPGAGASCTAGAPGIGCSEVFEADVTFPGMDQTVRFRVCRYVPSDMGRRESLSLAAAAMQLARVGMDIVLGRVPADRLARAANAVIVHKLETMALLYRNYLQWHPEMVRRIRMTVTQAVGVEAVVRSPDHMEIVVHLAVACNDYWSSVVFDLVDGRWMCTSLDLG